MAPPSNRTVYEGNMKTFSIGTRKKRRSKRNPQFRLGDEGEIWANTTLIDVELTKKGEKKVGESSDRAWREVPKKFVDSHLVEAKLQECGQWPPTSPIKQSTSDSSLDDLWSMSRNPTVASFPRQNAQGEIPIDAFCGSDIATQRLHLNLRQLQISPPTTTPLLPLTPTDDETMQIEPIIKQEPEEKNYEMDEDMCHSVEDWKGSDSPIPVMPKKGSLPLPPLAEGTEEPEESKPEPGASIAMPPALVYIITIRFSRETRGMDRNNGGLTVTMHRHMPGALFICTACSTLFQVRDPSFHDLPDLDPNNVEWSIIKWRRPFVRTGKFIRTSDEEPRHFEWWETTTPRQPSLNRVVIDCPACKFEGKTTLLDVTVKSHERSRLGLTLKRDSPTQSSKPEL